MMYHSSIHASWTCSVRGPHMVHTWSTHGLRMVYKLSAQVAFLSPNGLPKIYCVQVTTGFENCVHCVRVA